MNGSPQKLNRASSAPSGWVSARMNEIFLLRAHQCGSCNLPLPPQSVIFGKISVCHKACWLSSRTNLMEVTRGFSIAGRSSASKSGCVRYIDRDIEQDSLSTHV